MREMTIRVVSYPINGKLDAAFYNLIEGASRATGWAIVIGIVLVTINITKGADDAAPAATQLQENGG